jgi:hypothetical protein
MQTSLERNDFCCSISKVKTTFRLMIRRKSVWKARKRGQEKNVNVESNKNGKETLIARKDELSSFREFVENLEFLPKISELEIDRSKVSDISAAAETCWEMIGYFYCNQKSSYLLMIRTRTTSLHGLILESKSFIFTNKILKYEVLYSEKWICYHIKVFL